jgi:hypothetical protein
MLPKFFVYTPLIIGAVVLIVVWIVSLLILVQRSAEHWWANWVIAPLVFVITTGVFLFAYFGPLTNLVIDMQHNPDITWHGAALAIIWSAGIAGPVWIGTQLLKLKESSPP